MRRAVEIARGEHVQVLGDEVDGGVAMRRRFGDGLQLQLEALRDVARAHARGLEVVHVAQRDVEVLDLEVRDRAQRGFVKLFQALLEVAVFVEVAHDERGHLLVALGEAGERELLQQVLLERGLGGGELREVVAILVLGARAAGGRVLVAEAMVVGERGGLVAAVVAARLLAGLALAQVVSPGGSAGGGGVPAASSGGPRSERSRSGFSAR